MTTNFNLNAMAVAKKYNDSIYSWVSANSAGRRHILDFGAGTGLFANRFECAIDCVEPDADCLKSISAAHRIYSDISAVPVENQYDFVYSLNVLEHIKDDEKALSMLRSRMSRTGRLCLLLPAWDNLFTSMDHHVGHHRRYSPDSVTDLLQRSGFELKCCAPFDSLGYYATLALKAKERITGWDGTYSTGSVEFYDRYLFPISRLMDGIKGKHGKGKNLMVEAVVQC